ncbi:hypothetical protein [Longispora albida]|uniref:hypothetical protein n=1 Tax=Longispora albida TaxID=203523 RepID=UPI000370CE10|nr:hypothetical protein [Longispora albida]
MFTVEERDAVRARLVELAQADSEVAGAAFTGSYAGNGGDRWSDIDLVLGVGEGLEAVIGRWTATLASEFGAVHHWDMPAGPSVYRMFLLASGLEVDLGFAPRASFGPRGPAWRQVFGEAAQLEAARVPGLDEIAGMAWHHTFRAWHAIERGQPWQALHWLGETRGQVFALIARRLGVLGGFTVRPDSLPVEVTAPLVASVSQSLAPGELHRALRVVIGVLITELHLASPDLASRLAPLLQTATG